MSITTAALRDADGQIEGMLALLEDITERKQAEERTRQVVTGARCILWYALVEEREGRLLWDMTLPNEDTAAQFLPLDIPAGGSYVDAWYRSKPDEDRERSDRMGAEALCSGACGHRQEFRCRQQGGKIRWFWENARVEALEPHRWRVVGVCTDITDRKRMEEQLQHVVAGARCLLWHADVDRWDDGTFDWETASPTWRPRSGSSPWTSRPAGISVTPGTPASSRRSSRNGLREPHGDPHRGSRLQPGYRCRRADGEVCWLSEDVRIQSACHGRWSLVGVCTDITDRKRAEGPAGERAALPISRPELFGHHRRPG